MPTPTPDARLPPPPVEELGAAVHRARAQADHQYARQAGGRRAQREQGAEGERICICICICICVDLRRDIRELGGAA